MSGTDEQTELTRRAAAGDELALTLLLQRTRPRLLEYVGRRIPADLRASVGADDIAQQAHVEAYRNVARFTPRGERAFERWLWTIALRKLRDAIRLRRAAKRGGPRAEAALAGAGLEDSIVGLLDVLAGPGRTPSRQVARQEALDAIRAALDALDPPYREAIWLAHIESRPIAEVARHMGRSQRSVHGLLRRGLAQLRERLGRESRFLTVFG